MFQVSVDLDDVLILQRRQRPRLGLETCHGAIMVGSENLDCYLAAQIIPAAHNHAGGTPTQYLPELETW